jgi:hypothetical protein
MPSSGRLLKAGAGSAAVPWQVLPRIKPGPEREQSVGFTTGSAVFEQFNGSPDLAGARKLLDLLLDRQTGVHRGVMDQGFRSLKRAGRLLINRFL